MSDRPPENPDAPSGDPARTLNDILAALSNVGSGETDGERSPESVPMQGAVAELTAALDQLFELVRSDRAEQRARIAELEAALSAAHARIRQLEAGEKLDDIPAPPPNDFGQLREAAERLRQRTEELFRDAGPVTAAAQASGRASVVDESDAPADWPATDEDAEARIQAARESVETSMADDHPATPATDEAEEFAVLRIFPGAAESKGSSIDVESDLAIEDEQLEAVAVAAPAPSFVEAMVPDQPVEPTADPLAGQGGDDESAEAEAEAEAEPAAVIVEAAAPTPGPLEKRPEPTEVAPRPARKRRAGMRRRRIDARKLAGVDPATALRAMVSAIDDIWTAGVTLDLVIALTDGGSLKVTGGHNKPLAVLAVKSGTPARSTVTATTAQLIPLFGRLDLTDEQSAPLIHGPRRDADLLVGWIDRAQRLTPEPL